jgi:hypothetical protein
MRHPPPSEEEPSDDGSDDSELEVALDQDGRVVFGDTSQLDFGFRSLHNAVSPASDPQRSAVQTEIETALVGESFFLPADQPPRWCVTALVYSAF